jgi:hypothetical protein
MSRQNLADPGGKPACAGRGARPTLVLAVVSALFLIAAAGCATDGAWTVTAPVASGTRPDRGAPSAVGCASATFCVAVGSGITAVWNGTDWRDTTPAGFGNASAVACPTVGRCLMSGGLGPAGGPPLLGDGTTWAPTADPQSLFTPAADRQLACAGPDDCLAVVDGTTNALAAWDGTSWRKVELPGPAYWPGQTLACAPGACLVTGRDDGSVAARWDGTRFVEAASPVVPIGDLACASPTFCLGRSPALAPGTVLRWDGTAWSSVTLPGVAEAQGTVGDMACGEPESCRVLTHAGAPGEPAHTEIVRWDGSTSGSPANGGPPTPAILACGAGDACVVVGSLPNGDDEGPGTPVAARWDGTIWTPTAPPVHLRNDGRLTSVSCPTDSWCLAVGTAGNGLRNGWRLDVQVWTGRSWSVLPGPDLAADYRPRVSCPTASSCTVVGLRGGTPARAVIARWDGQSWSTAEVPGAASGDADVSCAAPDACVARIGGDQVLSWDGARWTAMPLPETVGAPPNGSDPLTPEAHLGFLACPAPDTCVVHGTRKAQDPLGRTIWRPVFFHWAGGTWTERAAPLPEGGGDGGYGGLACPAADHCVAVGSVRGLPGTTPRGDFPAIATWDGTSWTAQRGPSSAVGGYFSAVSCAGSRCLTLGSDYENGSRPVAAISNDATPGSWLVTQPPAFTQEGVSCRPATCSVVGNRAGAGGNVQAAARYTFDPQVPLG